MKKLNRDERLIWEAYAHTNVNEAEQGQKELIVLVGPPSIGKSTWVAQNSPDSFVINRDDIVTDIAAKYNMTYDDMFANPRDTAPDPKYGEVIERPSYLPEFLGDHVFSTVTQANGEVHQALQAKFPEAIQSGRDIVIDMTNMSVGARMSSMNHFKEVLDNYKKIAVVFNFEGSDVQKAIKNIAQIQTR